MTMMSRMTMIVPAPMYTWIPFGGSDGRSVRALVPGAGPTHVIRNWSPPVGPRPSPGAVHDAGRGWPVRVQWRWRARASRKSSGSAVTPGAAGSMPVAVA